MTEKEAIRRIMQIMVLTNNSKQIGALYMARIALEKQIPVKGRMGNECCVCGSCGAYAPEPRGIDGEKYQNTTWCWKCGQAIDWSEE